MEISPVYKLDANEYNKKLAEALKQIPEFQAPEWSLFVKSGVAKKRPPQEEDFWHKRAASILRQAYVRGIVGVNRLRTRYGSKLNRGFKPERFRKASGKIIRTILQQAEKAGFLEKYNESGKRAGRKLTEKGRQFMEGIENKSIKEKPIPNKIKNEQEKEEPQREEEIKVTNENKNEELNNKEGEGN